MIILLYLVIYAVIGVILGRVWITACKRRGEDDLEPMYAAFGIAWPVMFVVLPLAFFIVWSGTNLLMPTFRWLFKHIDRAVAAVVPEKAA